MSGWKLSVSGVVCVVCCFITTAQGEVTREQASRLGVDVVFTRGGRELRGSIVSREEEGSLIIARPPGLVARRATTTTRHGRAGTSGAATRDVRAARRADS